MTPDEVRALIERVEAEERSAGWAVSDVLAVCRLLREAQDRVLELEESLLDEQARVQELAAALDAKEEQP